MPLSSGEGSISTSCRFLSVSATFEWSEFGKKEALDIPGVGGGVAGTLGVCGTGSFTALELVSEIFLPESNDGNNKGVVNIVCKFFFVKRIVSGFGSHTRPVHNTCQ